MTVLTGLGDEGVGLADFIGQYAQVEKLFQALGENRTSFYVCGGSGSNPFGQCPNMRVWFDKGTVASIDGAIPVVFQAE